MYLINFNFFLNKKKTAEKYNVACWNTIGKNKQKVIRKKTQRTIVYVAGI